MRAPRRAAGARAKIPPLRGLRQHFPRARAGGDRVVRVAAHLEMSSADVAASPPLPANPADADERERLMAQLRAVMRLKRGAVENRNSVVGCAIATYQHVLDGVIADVAVELHRALALGLDTLDSVEQRVPPPPRSSRASRLPPKRRRTPRRARTERTSPPPPRTRNLHPPRRARARATSTEDSAARPKNSRSVPCARRGSPPRASRSTSSDAWEEDASPPAPPPRQTRRAEARRRDRASSRGPRRSARRRRRRRRRVWSR